MLYYYCDHKERGHDINIVRNISDNVRSVVKLQNTFLDLKKNAN